MLPTNEQLIELLKPALDELSPTKYGQVEVKITYGCTKPVDIVVQVWDAENSKFHHGTSFAEAAESQKKFNPLEQKRQELADAQAKVEKLTKELNTTPPTP